MNSKDQDKFLTTIYINSEQCAKNEEITSVYSNDIKNQKLYANQSTIKEKEKNITHIECNNELNNSKTAPPIRPRMSLLKKKFVIEDLQLFHKNKELNKLKNNLIGDNLNDENLNNENLKDENINDKNLIDKNLIHKSSNDKNNENINEKNLIESKLIKNNFNNDNLNDFNINDNLIDINKLNQLNLDNLDEPIYSDITYDEKENKKFDFFLNSQFNENLNPPPLPPRKKVNQLKEFENKKIDFFLENQNQFNPFLDKEYLKTINLKERAELSSNLIDKNFNDNSVNEDFFNYDNVQLKNTNTLPKIKKTQDNENFYGKILKVNSLQSSDDDGTIKSTSSLLSSNKNFSSNDTFFNSSIKKTTKPKIGIITPFSIRTTQKNSTESLNIQKSLTVKLNEELKLALNLDKEIENNFKKEFVNKNYSFDNSKNIDDDNFFKQESPSLENFKTNFSKFDFNEIQKKEIEYNKKFFNENKSGWAKLSDNENKFDLSKTNQNENNFKDSDLHNKKDFLYKTGSSRKQFYKRWCVLSDSAVFYYNDEKFNLNDLKNQAKGHIELNEILFINVIQDQVSLISSRLKKAIKSIKGISNVELYQFNIGIISENGRIHLLAAENCLIRENWVSALAFKIKPKFKASNINFENIDSCGYLNVKIGLTGLWTKCWVVLKQRELTILILDMIDIEENGKKVDLIVVDLRKVMTIGYNVNPQIDFCETVYENGLIFYLNRRYENTLYFQADYKSHTDEWFNVIENNWILPDNGVLEDQLLAPNSIPIAVEKCLNFISTYNGISTKNIYKASGDDTYIRTIIENLKSNSLFDWHIRPEDGFTVLDVADALKCYLKSFPECILTEKLYQNFLKINSYVDLNERLVQLKNLLKRMSIVNHNTLKKLICHFILITENCDENEMDLNSLSFEIAPYILFSKISAQPEINVSVNLFKDLVNYYVWLFDVKSEEMDKERKIENSLKELRKIRVKQDKDELLVGIYLFNKQWGRCVNVPINSTMTADDLIFYVTKIANLNEPATKLCVCEVVSNDQLERVLHYSEIILNVTLGWTIKWPQQDAKSNYLLIKTNSLYESLEDYLEKRLNTTPLNIINGVKYSEEGKNFKKVFLGLVNSKLIIYKYAKSPKTLASWQIEDLTWYLGYEKKRNPPTKFCLTLLNKNDPVVRSKDCLNSVLISFNNEDELARWLAAIICCEHPTGIYPLIHSINLMD